MKADLQLFRLGTPCGTAIDFYRADSHAQLAQLATRLPRQERDLQPPAVVIAGRRGANVWVDAIDDIRPSVAALCLSSESDIGRVCIGISRTLRAYEVLTGKRQIDIRTKDIIQNVIQSASALLSSIVVVTEVSVAKYDERGEILWEYSHYEPIDSSWIERDRLHLIDFEKQDVSISLNFGRLD